MRKTYSKNKKIIMMGRAPVNAESGLLDSIRVCE